MVTLFIKRPLLWHCTASSNIFFSSVKHRGKKPQMTVTATWKMLWNPSYHHWLTSSAYASSLFVVTKLPERDRESITDQTFVWKNLLRYNTAKNWVWSDRNEDSQPPISLLCRCETSPRESIYHITLTLTCQTELYARKASLDVRKCKSTGGRVITQGPDF